MSHLDLLNIPPDELAALGLAVDHISSVEVICRRRVNSVYRICCDGYWLVLKWIERPEMSVELRAYELLAEQQVPILQCWLGRQALVMEDLAHSDTRRLADEADLAKAETGHAVGRWYRQFHQAGRVLFQSNLNTLISFKSQAGRVTGHSVRHLAKVLQLPEPEIKFAAEQIDWIVYVMQRRPQTLNYNDFDFSNLALHRSNTGEAIIFDYHLLGKGLAYSDYQNVMSRLRGPACEAFAKAYGPVDEVERVLNAPVATLFALLQAAECPSLPAWAKPLMDDVSSGKLAQQIKDAINVLMP